MTKNGAYIKRFPASLLKRGPKWHLICYTRGSGQYPGGNHDFTGDQPPALLIPCEDGTCQRIEFCVPRAPEPAPSPESPKEGVPMSEKPTHAFVPCEVPDYCDGLVWDADGKRTCGLPRSAHPAAEPAPESKS